MPLPMPDAAPVTTATRPSSLPTTASSRGPRRRSSWRDVLGAGQVEPVPHEEHGRLVLRLVVAADESSAITT